MDSIDKLVQLFEKFPGIGPRQARRFVQYLLSAPSGARTELAELIKRLGAESRQCKRCLRWFTSNHQGSTLIPEPAKVELCCPICADEHRDAATIFVVEKDADIENVERSGFRGLYFVLGGTIPLGSDTPEKHIRLRELLKRAEAYAASKGDVLRQLREIILGLSATTEGDHTRQIVHEELRLIAEKLSIKISSLGRGLSTGSELEYADPNTISQALANRT